MSHLLMSHLLVSPLLRNHLLVSHLLLSHCHHIVAWHSKEAGGLHQCLLSTGLWGSTWAANLTKVRIKGVYAARTTSKTLPL